MNAVPAPAAQATATAPAPKATTPAKKAPAKKAATKAPAKKTAATKAPAKKATAPVKKATAPKVPTVAERDMTVYDAAMAEYKELRRDIADAVASIAYQARRATPTEGYAKTHEEALAKFTSAVSAVRETARLLNEVAPKK